MCSQGDVGFWRIVEAQNFPAKSRRTGLRASDFHHNRSVFYRSRFRLASRKRVKTNRQPRAAMGSKRPPEFGAGDAMRNAMSAICSTPLPEKSLLNSYRLAGAYTDCYLAVLPQRVSQVEFVEAFYTNWLFKAERLILALILSKASSDEEAKKLAKGETHDFSAWRAESRSENQLLLCDFLGRTRSWLMCVGDGANEQAMTYLYFGSAVRPRVDPASGRKTFGPAFHLLAGFHRLYSRALLRQAASRLIRLGSANGGLSRNGRID
jgi:hypothetical protein